MNSLRWIKKKKKQHTLASDMNHHYLFLYKGVLDGKMGNVRAEQVRRKRLHMHTLRSKDERKPTEYLRRAYVLVERVQRKKEQKERG